MKPLIRSQMTDDYKSQEYRTEAELYPEYNEEMTEAVERFWEHHISNLSKSETRDVYRKIHPFGQAVIRFIEESGGFYTEEARLFSNFFDWFIERYSKNFVGSSLQHKKVYNLFLIYFYTIDSSLEYCYDVYKYKYQLEHQPDLFPELDDFTKTIAINNILDFRWACVGWTLKEYED